MTPEVQRLFEAAADLPIGQREAFINDQTPDEAVRREVLSLLQHDGLAEPFFAGSLQREALSLVSSLDWNAGRRVGNYRILSLLGRGGMGAVYLAERADGAFEQRVALKLVELINPPDFLFDRFRRERLILAQLNHPGIATLYDGGETPEGFPFFVMECVRGEPIDCFCERAKLELRQRLELFVKACHAVQYAHQNYIVHRDLKPAHILVTPEGQPKLLDFGIAKVLNPASMLDSQASTRLLTPEYASPEQMRGEAITVATDVYSLGAILYQIVSGRRAHPIAKLSPLEGAQAVALQGVAPCRDLPADLNAILQKALAKDPARRYSSAGDFAKDLTRFLSGKPVNAAPDSWRYCARNFLRRHRLAGPAAACAAVALALSAGITEWKLRHGAGRASELHSIAVLPLRTVAGERNQVLELGLADTLIARLSQLPGLEVRSIEAVSGYAGTDPDPAKVGRELGVDAVLEGTTHAAGGVRRVNLRLISVKDGRSRWSQSFDRKMGEVLPLEDSVSIATAEALAPALRSTLTSAQDRMLTLRPTQDEEAYRLYLEGRYQLARRDAPGFDKATARFESAIARDPNFAEAHAALAETWMIRYDGRLPDGRNRGIERVREHALRAIQLKPSMGWPYRILAVVAENYDYDRKRAEELYRKAIQLEPNDAATHQFYGECLGLMGRFREAEQEMQIAYRLDPVSLILQTDWARVEYFARRWDLAEQRLNQVLEADPHFLRALDALFVLRLCRRDFPGARQVLSRIERADSGRPVFHFALVSAAEGNRKEFARYVALARRTSLDLSSLGAMGPPFLLSVAGRRKESIEALEDVVSKHLAAGVIGLEVEPLVDNLRREPRFQSLIERMGATEPPEVKSSISEVARFKGERPR